MRISTSREPGFSIHHSFPIPFWDLLIICRRLASRLRAHVLQGHPPLEFEGREKKASRCRDFYHHCSFSLEQASPTMTGAKDTKMWCGNLQRETLEPDQVAGYPNIVMRMKIKIEGHIPTPVASTRSNAKKKSNFDEMNINSAYLVLSERHKGSWSSQQWNRLALQVRSNWGESACTISMCSNLHMRKKSTCDQYSARVNYWRSSKDCQRRPNWQKEFPKMRF